MDVGGVGLRDVAAHQRHAPVSPQRRGHAAAEVAMALADALDAHWQAEAGSVGRDGQDDVEAAAGSQRAQQGGQRGDVEAQRGPVADVARQPAFHGAQAGRSGEDDDGVFHP